MLQVKFTQYIKKIAASVAANGTEDLNDTQQINDAEVDESDAILDPDNSDESDSEYVPPTNKSKRRRS